MNRSYSTPAIILKNYRIADIHKGVVMLSRDDGLVHAIAHGAYSHRGKLRGTTNFLCAGTAYLYANPIRSTIKLTDMDVSSYFSGIREDINRFYTASLWAESIVKTQALGGESDRLHALLIDALTELDTRPGSAAELLNIHFIWRFLLIGGMQPDLVHCAATGEFLAEGEPIYYSPGDNGFCSRSNAHDQMIVWQPGTAAFMRHAGTLPFADALRVRPPDGAPARIKRVLYAVLLELVDAPLNSLTTGAGIL